MKNYVQPGNTITVPAPAGGAVSGKPLAIGSLRGFASATAAAGEDVAVVRTGVHEYKKATGAAWAIGDNLYYSAANDYFTKTATDNVLFGFAAKASASGETLGEICLGDTI
ncbi:DUF2190 family protein [Mesorhizobium sp. CAU 1732]|uniref:DUF2190 family protein n=1 Tax=Mesorhizobium sp. CAU 1732 TaxID=3140358 RepID=UPI0032609BC2